jgi:hypothetical protein
MTILSSEIFFTDSNAISLLDSNKSIAMILNVIDSAVLSRKRSAWSTKEIREHWVIGDTYQ